MLRALDPSLLGPSYRPELLLDRHHFKRGAKHVTRLTFITASLGMKYSHCSFAPLPALLALLVSCEKGTAPENGPPDLGPSASTHTSSPHEGDAATTTTANANDEPSVKGEQDTSATGIVLEGEYEELMCAYYLRCVPTAMAAYGADVQTCAESSRIAQRMAQLSLNSPPALTPAWDLECVRSMNVGALECPSIEGREMVFTDAAQQLQQHIGHCLRRDLPCASDDDCLLGGVCGNNSEACGRCEPEPNKCFAYNECSFGETCVDSACVPLAANGEACKSPYECLGQACVDNSCTSAKAEGAQCERSLECFASLRCHEGTCSKPGNLGDACDGVTTQLPCKFGLECVKGVCEQAGTEAVPVGGVCFGVASCVAYAECSGSVCTPSETMCIRDAQCGALEYCDQECVPKRALGDECASHHACLSRFCSNKGVCADPAECQ